MDGLGELWRRLLFAFRRRQFDRDLEEEMRFHLEMKARDAGAAAARRSFGSLALWLEDSRRAWGWSGLEACLDDVRYAARGLRKDAGFTLVAVLTMTLGIGACTAIFSVVHGVLLRPLPFREPGRLAALWETRQKNHEQRSVVSYSLFEQWREQCRSFEDMAAWDGATLQTTVAGEPSEVPGAVVTSGFFRTLAVRPFLGRSFVPEEHRQGSDAVILSYGLWRRLGGDRAIGGKAVRFGRSTLTVVGVMPRGFAFPEGSSDMWLPLAVDDPRNHGYEYLRVIGRLKPGVPVTQARSELETITARLPEARDGIGANVLSLQDEIAGDARGVLLILMGAVACVLLIACANLANLMLVRATGRRRDLALRLALGAGRWRVVRSLLAESLLISLSAGAAGVAAAYGLVRLFVAFDPIHLPRIHEVAVDGPVLFFAAVAALITGLAFGLLPALQASKPGLSGWLREAPCGSTRGRQMLAVAQLALAVVLVVGTGLLLRSFVARVSVPLGFRPEGVLGIELPWSANRNLDQLLDQLRGLPGVTAAGGSTLLPQIAPFFSCAGCIQIEGYVPSPGQPDRTGLVVATPGYFEAAGMRLRAGRFFTSADGADAPKAVIINEAMARRDFDGRDPLGRRIRYGDAPWATVVGVAGNVKGFGAAGNSTPAIYFPKPQFSWLNPVAVVVRTAVPPAALAGAVRREIRAWDANMVVKRIDTVDNMLSTMVATPRFYLWLMAGFAALALAVSAVGIYGTLNYSVARRTHEIGVRMALGARRTDVGLMVLRQAGTLTAIGLALGLAAAWLAAQLLETLLFGVGPTDALAFGGSAAVLVLVALVACYLPARRAATVDPNQALRHE